MADEMMEDAPTHTGTDVVMSDADEHRRTDHDRQGGTGSLTAGGKAGLERLNADMGSLYKLCQNPHPISRPHPTQNLISLYNLDKIAATVIRRDPVTGEKINTLRKSYQGKLKQLGLSGKNKANPAEGDMMNILAVPDEEWQNQQVFGKEIPQTLPTDLLAKLDRAVQMAPGKLRSDVDSKWRSIIATDDATKPKSGADGAVKKPLQNATVQAQLQGRISAAPSPAIKPTRPERAGTKRRYNDASFKGYGEGYADDDLAESTAGEDDGRGNSLKKKRRKVAIAV